MKYLLILLTNFVMFSSFATGAYGMDYYYQFTVCNSSGQILSNEHCKITVDGKSYELQSDSVGIIAVHLGGSENCLSGKSFFARVFNPNDWSWIPKLITVECKGLSFGLKKNWKKYCRKRNKKTEFYNYETGKVTRNLKGA